VQVPNHQVYFEKSVPSGADLPLGIIGDENPARGAGMYIPKLPMENFFQRVCPNRDKIPAFYLIEGD